MASYLFGFTAALCLLCFLPADVRVVALKLDSDRTTIRLESLSGGYTRQSGPQNSQSYISQPVILNNIDGVVYIGGNETLMRLWIDDNDVLQSRIHSDPFVTNEPVLVISCSQQNDADPVKVCWNFIRVVEIIRRSDSEDELFICGTNARSPLCYLCNQDISSCPNIISTNTEMVPHLPNQSPLTAVFPRGDGSVLYGGNVVDSTFLRSALMNDGTATLELDTVTVARQFLKDPVFVGKPVKYDSYMFLFYREPAIEYSSQGNKIYSRIARVCLNDTGGTINTMKFATYIKARLNCSLPDTLFPYYFSEIQDVIWDEAKEEFHAVFTSPNLGPKASAVCLFRMADIMTLFDDGEFKHQLDGDVNAQWQAIAVPNPGQPRPGTCQAGHTTNYPPLMDKLVPNFNDLEQTPGNQPIPPANFITSDAPILHAYGVRFTSLAIDAQNCVYYFGTTDGTLIKAFKFDCADPAEAFTSVEITGVATEGSSVTGLELLTSGNVKYLAVTMEEGVITMPLTERPMRCSARCLEECNVKGPECRWQNMACECTSANPAECVKEEPQLLLQPQVSRVTSCDNNEVFLYCQADFGPCADRPVTVSWDKADNATFISDNNHLVQLTQLTDKLLELSVTAHEDSIGIYNCTAEVDGSVLSSKQVEVVVDSCLTNGSLKRRCDKYRSLREMHPQVNGDDTCSAQVEDCSSCPLLQSP